MVVGACRDEAAHPLAPAVGPWEEMDAEPPRGVACAAAGAHARPGAQPAVAACWGVAGPSGPCPLVSQGCCPSAHPSAALPAACCAGCGSSRARRRGGAGAAALHRLGRDSSASGCCAGCRHAASVAVHAGGRREAGGGWHGGRPGLRTVCVGRHRGDESCRRGGVEGGRAGQAAVHGRCLRGWGRRGGGGGSGARAGCSLPCEGAHGGTTAAQGCGRSRRRGCGVRGLGLYGRPSARRPSPRVRVRVWVRARVRARGEGGCEDEGEGEGEGKGEGEGED